MIDTTRERLKIDTRPVKLRIESEPYVIFMGRAFIPVIDVYEVRKRREYILLISAQSISIPLKQWQDHEKSLVHIEFWINKASEERSAKYELELA